MEELGSESKFENCCFRSDTYEVRSVKTCRCSQHTEIKGYHCSIHDIFPLQKEFCQACKEFKQKE